MQNKSKKRVKHEQPRKDSKQPRVNFDNERKSKFIKDEIKDISETTKSNDVKWYAHNAELLKAAASIPFSQSTGMPLGFKGADPNTELGIPGVMQLLWNPTIGGWNDNAINSAKESVYSYTVHANSRNTSYSAADQMLVILSGMQVFAMLANAIRAYGLMRTFDQRNSFLPKALVEACGFNYADLVKNLSRMWFDINELIARSSQIWIPNIFPVLDRWFWLNSNVYMDSDSVKGQYYILTQDRFYGYHETHTSSEGGAFEMMCKDGTFLELKDDTKAFRNDEQNTWDTFMTVINSMIDKLLQSEDRGIIMGDILKAFGSEKIYAITPIPADYQVIPVYDKEVLTQIENSTVFAGYYNTVRQNPNNGILYTSWMTYGTGSDITDMCLPDQQMLNFHQKEDPIPEQIMVATRLMTLGCHFNTGNKVSYAIPYTMGTEYVSKSRICYMSGGQSIGWQEIRQRRNNPGDFGTSGNLYLWTAFDWSPWLYQVTQDTVVVGADTATVKVPQVYAAFGDFDNYTVIDYATLKKMHTTAVYSEFGVPTI